MNDDSARRPDVSYAVVPAKGRGQDRVAVIQLAGAVVLAVADGSGGMRGGAEAAEQAVRMISDAARAGIAQDDPNSWVSLLTRIDETPGAQRMDP